MEWEGLQEVTEYSVVGGSGMEDLVGIRPRDGKGGRISKYFFYSEPKCHYNEEMCDREVGEIGG